MGWIHIKSLEKKVIEWILKQREQSLFTSFDDFFRKVPAGLEQIILLIRVGSFRNLGYQKKELLWEAHAKQNTKRVFTISNDLFELEDVNYDFPVLLNSSIEDAYDELEILGFTLQNPYLLLLNPPNTYFRANNINQFIGKEVSILGNLVTLKPTRTKKGERMFFGYFTDINGEFFDTVHFPKSCEKYPFKGSGIYHLKGKVMEEFSHCSIQVSWMEKLPLKADPRME